MELAVSALTKHGAFSCPRNGYRLLASTRDSRIPTIVVSGVATPAHIERAYAEYAIFAFVQKQAFDRSAFLRTVNEVRAAAATSSELDCLTKREREVLVAAAATRAISGGLVTG